LLADLLGGEDLDVFPATAPKDLAVTGLTSDSRKVQPGFLFAALPGTKNDGRAFIEEAAARGAVAVLAPHGTDAPSLPVIADDNPRKRFSQLAARFYGAQPDTIAAVTGTNGKTSTVDFLRQIWLMEGTPAASIGTLGVITGDGRREGSLTTPDPVTLHRNLAELAHAGVRCLAMEASSHGLDQFRLDGVRVAAAAFSNLTRDHLDYHATMGAYLDAKLRLFCEVMQPGGAAVLNADSDAFGVVRDACEARGHRILSVGRNGDDLKLKSAEPFPGGQNLSLQVMGKAATVSLPLAGAFQADNALLAAGLAIACGMAPARVLARLENLKSVPGRLELVGKTSKGAPVYIDYAHTPDALETVIGALRPHTERRLWVVFGCGGDRDPGKRPEMGRIACRLSDRAIVTDDNPRSEQPAAIRAQILAACPGGKEIGDRRAAIFEAVAGLEQDDLLIVAGKGHERGQIIGSVVHPFNDADVVREAIEAAG
jgi:UDP-N-acetylmuramoyl-L-alanyl-D-glutamate--2,6-diaminopimelate ligase